MKRFVLVVMTVGLFASTANAASIWMEWQGLGPAAREVTLLPSETAWIDVYVDLAPIDSMSTMAYANENAAGLQQTGTLVNPAINWADGSVNGVLGPLTGQQVAFAGPPNLVGGGVILLGSQEIHQLQLPPADWDVTFDHASTLFLDQAGTGWTHAPNYAGAYANYYGYGAGSPGVTGAFGTSVRDPLIVHCVPEPGSLALLALGGLAFLRRRR